LILIDSSAFIEFLNRTGSTTAQVVERLIHDDAECAIADLVLTELLQGIKSDKEFRTVRDALLAFPILSLKGAESCVRAAELYRTCRTKGLTIRSTIDLFIAQIALENDAVLLHNDRDFEAIASVSTLKIY
jgi:predicted nucleic acid-binding protein